MFKNGYYFRDYLCVEGDNSPIKMNYPSTSIYVVLTRECNASCKFCTFRGKVDNVDVDKFIDTLQYLLTFCDINTIHFTGGEPSLCIDILNDLCDMIKGVNELITTSVNTNGIYLEELGKIETLDNIALSRHAISDKDNQYLFNSDSIPNLSRLIEFKNKSKLHLSCNLIKGFIDNETSIKDYLEFAGDIVGCNDVGFVGLMKVNDFCIDSYIDFPILKDICCSRQLQDIDKDTNKVYCKCSNYLYTTKKLNIVSAYYRHVVANRCNNDIFIWENNEIRQGW